MSYTYIACDPGKLVTLAFVSRKGRLISIAHGEQVAVELKKGDWENSAGLIAAQIKHWQSKANSPVVGIVERVHARSGEGASSINSWLGSRFIFEGVCAGLGLPCVAASPQRWKRDMGLLGKAGYDLKEIARQDAIARFPSFRDYFRYKKDHDKAEAALLGYWGAKHSQFASEEN